MNITKEEVQRVLDALTCREDHPHWCAHCDDYVDRSGEVVTLLQSKLAEPDAEPFGYWHQGPNEDESEFFLRPNGPGSVACDRCIPLFTHPAPKQASDFDLRGRLAQLKCWHRLTGAEAQELIEVVQRERLSENVPMTEEQAAAIAGVNLKWQMEGYSVSGVFDLVRAIEKHHGIGS